MLPKIIEVEAVIVLHTLREIRGAISEKRHSTWKGSLEASSARQVQVNAPYPAESYER